jgi:serine protease Do
MRFFAVTLIATLSLAGTSYADFSGPNSKEVVQKVKKSVIRVQNIQIDSPTASGGLGGGSGFVFEVDYDEGVAYALTNFHVSGKAFNNAVKFWDGAEYKAEMVAGEPGIDVALLRILDIPDERDLSDSEKTIVPAVLGDSDQVQIGELAVAMGNPGAPDGFNADRSNPYEDYLLLQTATDGVVTGRDTPIEFPLDIWTSNRGDYGPLYGTNFDYAFRSTVPINPGNSGGPLFNMRGEVIGINFYGGSFWIGQNYNHSIPINLAKDFAYQVLNTGKFQKPWTGMDIIMPANIRSSSTYTEFRERFKIDEIRVYGVRDDSPAEKGGLRENDVIVEVDGRKFGSPNELRVYVFEQEIGKMLEIRVKRNGQLHRDPIYVEVVPKRIYNSEFSV